jgi:integrase/recombinase XerD
MTLQEAYELFLAAKRRSDKTRKQYRHTLGLHFKGLGGPERDVETVTTEEVTKWVKRQEKLTLSPWTVNGRIKDVKAFWRWVDETKHINSSLWQMLKVKKFKPNRMRKMAISDEDLSRLLDHAKEVSEREYAIARLLADTGCRRAAVSKLRLSQIDFDDRFATLYCKGEEFYDAPLTLRVVDALRAYLKVRPPVKHDYVFVSMRSPHGPLTESGISSLWRRLTHDGEYESRSNMHALRHNFTSRLARKGVNMAYIQEALGHQDMKTTRLYVKVCQDTLRDIVDSVSVE